MAKQKRDGARFLALLGYCSVLLIGAPMGSLTHDVPGQKKPATTFFSPLECAALGLGSFSPKVRPFVPLLLAPFSLYKHAALTMKKCMPDNSVEGCTWLDYLNYNQAQASSTAELKELGVLLEKAFKPNELSLLFMGSAVVLLGAFCSLVRPVKASFLGFLLMAVSIYTSKPAGFLASFAFVFFLAAFSICDAEDLRMPRLMAVRKARAETRKRR